VLILVLRGVQFVLYRAVEYEYRPSASGGQALVGVRVRQVRWIQSLLAT